LRPLHTRAMQPVSTTFNTRLMDLHLTVVVVHSDLRDSFLTQSIFNPDENPSGFFYLLLNHAGTSGRF
jgi:hypothetical protein